MASKKFACVVVVMCMVVLGALVSEAAISCGEISTRLAPCLPFLLGGLGPSGLCCDGVKTVNDTASTTPDLQATCNCLKDLAAGVSGLNLGNAEALPSKCNVDVHYKISPSTDCSTYV